MKLGPDAFIVSNSDVGDAAATTFRSRRSALRLARPGPGEGRRCTG
jgi:hypothetical protein